MKPSLIGLYGERPLKLSLKRTETIEDNLNQEQDELEMVGITKKILEVNHDIKQWNKIKVQDLVEFSCKISISKHIIESIDSQEFDQVSTDGCPNVETVMTVERCEIINNVDLESEEEVFWESQSQFEADNETIEDRKSEIDEI